MKATSSSMTIDGNRDCKLLDHMFTFVYNLKVMLYWKLALSHGTSRILDGPSIVVHCMLQWKNRVLADAL